MSYRRQGRFTTSSATEAYQRQLTAPVHKWRKAWVAPAGLQPESSYKICKWVRVDDKDIDDLMDGEEDEEAGDDEEGDENMDDNEGDEADEEAVKPSEAPTPVEKDVDRGTPAEDMPPPTIQITATSPIAQQAEPSESSTKPIVPSPLSNSITENEIDNHTNLPSNAIELTNTAPGGTEIGHGDLGAHAGIEIHKAESKSPVTTNTELEEGKGKEDGESKMEVDVGLETAKNDGTIVDEGLVMGEMVPPSGSEALPVVGGDHEPPAMEKTEIPAKAPGEG